MPVKSYRDLDVWKFSKELARDIYEITKRFPQDERYGLVQQIRRAAVSVMSNIAEGSGRRSKPEFMRFINIASGSLCEMEAQLLLAVDLGYVDSKAAGKIIANADRISKMLYALYQSLSKTTTPVTEYQVPSTEYA